MRGQLYNPEYKPRLSGHETFPLRYGWLKKAYDAVRNFKRIDGSRSVFADTGAIAEFGVGKNMVRSMRHWAIAAGVVSEDGRTTTAFGRHLFADDGLDPYMEDPATAWLVHWRIAGNATNTTWFWGFSHCPVGTFDRDTPRARSGEVCAGSGMVARGCLHNPERCPVLRADLCPAGSVASGQLRVELPRFGGHAEHEVTLAVARALLALPREVGVHPGTGKTILAGMGRYGPWLRHERTYVSIPADDDVLTHRTEPGGRAA